ncbi:MAG: DUF4297 domain-containing protein [Proteobacteria bacterium]|nr:DUF4297 domain-containing protein [Pseudomonadota bacterium]
MLSEEAGIDVEAMSASDVGDETQRRFRYQINYTALKTLQILKQGSDIVAVYCEHIEDLLVEHDDGGLTGIQVKSRELNQKPFRSSDDSVRNSLIRFCVRAARYPGRFKRFILATNFVFYGGDGVEDLRNVLRRCRENPSHDGVGPRDKILVYLKSLATSSKIPFEQVVAILATVTLEERKTGIDQPDIELIHALGEFPGLRDRPWTELAVMAHSLRSHIWDVSSLGLTGFVLDVHDVVADLNQHLEQLRAKRKRVDEAVMRQLTQPQSDVGELLAVAGFTSRESIPPGLGKMELKMAAGAISYADIDEMKDDVSSLESAFLRWKEKYGLAEANKRLSHFQHLAKRAARDAEKAASAHGAPYGTEMFDALKGHAETICRKEQATMFGCRPEHLVGAAGLLSEECRVWWDSSRTLPFEEKP